MEAIASQITSLTIVYLIVYLDADQRKHQSSASLAFVWGIHRRPVNSPHKWPVTRKMFPFDDVIMIDGILLQNMAFGDKIYRRFIKVFISYEITKIRNNSTTPVRVYNVLSFFVFLFHNRE